MGWLRFLLAALVVAYHCQFHRVYQTIGAVAAVEAFFFVSGFYMAAAYPRYQGRFSALLFWLSRYLRLLPFYLTVLGLTWLFWLSGLATNKTAIFNAFDAADAPWLANITLLGQDLIAINEHVNLLLPVRQSWSISAELVFYLLTPLFLKCRNWQLIALACLSFAVKAYFTVSGDWRSAYFPFYSQAGYFILGIILFRLRAELTWSRSAALPLLLLTSAYLCVSHFAALELNGILPNAGMIVAIAITMPTAFAHSNQPISNFLGDISYGVYLVHVLMIEVLISLGWFSYDIPARPVIIWMFILVLALSSLVAGLFEIVVQEPLDRWRRKRFYGGAAPQVEINMQQST
ncbi:acyltransferase family protein [Bradyrhizobium sp. GCM10027634]|uniref:acyltransferase family protein n=1 Tax=unclassified Bradyrhizobium TaxID=2631580 RepID=UPI00263A4CCB|nr:acyltransferase [Bradyrhizobium sp. WYCCWR 12677]MDN5006372.1 acyltransferase [Bradyrhizobium sp. WYCCWR 12677]